jgi:LmbE family N-acetylglucosaminyl deacetylase
MPPSFVVDISDVANQRIEAIRAYKSQLFDPSSRAPMTKLSQPDFLAKVEAIHAYYGTLIGKRMGEGFFVKGILEAKDLVKQFT